MLLGLSILNRHSVFVQSNLALETPYFDRKAWNIDHCRVVIVIHPVFGLSPIQYNSICTLYFLCPLRGVNLSMSMLMTGFSKS